MIVDIRNLPASEPIRASVVVIGSGIAGAGVAMHLAREGVDVVMLESGREAFDPEIQGLNDLTFLGKTHRALDPRAGYHAYLPPQLRGVSRVRQFGGTSNVWTGKWKYLQASDFEERAWVPFSEWPISFEELLPHYRAAAATYGFEDLEAEARRSELSELRGHIADAGLKMSSFWWEKSPTRTRLRFGDEMRSLPNLRVILGATATELTLDWSGHRVRSVNCHALDGRGIEVSGDRIVLATGAIETPRLLLASDHDRPGGIGNAHDLVGRFYSDHPKHHSATLSPGPTARAFAHEFQYQPKPRFCVCFALDDATQKQRKLLEHVVYLKPIYASRRRAMLDTLRRRPPCRDEIGRVADYRVKLVTEQVPNRESRVRLSDARDRLGKRCAALDWRFTAQDHRSLAEIVELCRSRFEAAGLGRFDFGDAPPTLDNMTDAAHQMGTTRMARSAEHGVVDTDCRVFGTDNLYIAGSAVFPTGPSYSPTFTILALARRLAVHLCESTASHIARGDSAREAPRR